MLFVLVELMEAKLLNVNTKILGTSVFVSKVDASRTVAQLVNGAAELLDIDLSIVPEEVNVFDYIKEGLRHYKQVGY